MAFQTLDDAALAGRTVFCRVDLNTPVENGQPRLSARIVAHAKTVRDLSQKGAKTVLLAHQGRKGEDDFISLSGHAILLGEEVNKIGPKKGKTAGRAPSSPSHSPARISIQFVDDVCGEKAKAAIGALQNGQVLLLENVRFLDDETTFEKTGKSQLVEQLSPLCHVFVLDAFSCSHRAHASVVGFDRVPVLAGRVMAEELKALDNLRKPKRPVVFVLGGAKPDDSLPILQAWLEAGKLDMALTGGVMANLLILASGRELGGSLELLKKKKVIESLPQARELVKKFGKRIMMPTDVVLDERGKPKLLAVSDLPVQQSILDIGPQTAAAYADQIEHAGTIVMNGPMGVFEKEEFSKGTKVVLDAIASSRGFSLLGGGNTLDALDMMKIDRTQLGYVSLSGKALIEYLAGEKLPGVELVQSGGKR